MILCALAVAAFGCKGKDEDKKANKTETKQPAIDTATPAPAGKGLAARAQKEVARWTPQPDRTPLVTGTLSGSDCNAFDHYAKAATKAEPHLKSPAQMNAAGQAAKDPKRFDDVAKDLEVFTGNADAKAVAQMLRAGAACDKALIDKATDPTVDFTNQTAVRYMRTARAATVYALHLARSGDPGSAADLLLAVMQLGSDLMRGGPLVVWALGSALMRLPMPALRSVTKDLDAKKLTAVVGGLRTIDGGQARLEAALNGERLWRARLLLAFAQGKKSTLHPNWLKNWEPIVTKAGVGALLDMQDKAAAVLVGLDTKAVPEAKKQLAAMFEVWKTIDSRAKSDAFDPYLIRERLHTAELRATLVAAAVRAHHKKTKAWPSTLAELGSLPVDPISLKPFVYEKAKVVRAAKIDCGATPNCEQVVVSLGSK